MTMPAETALVVIAHGSREPDANADAVYLAREIEKRGSCAIVEAAFLEQVEPTIQQAVEKCVCRGATAVILVPYFLSSGVHVRRDLAEVKRRLSANYPGIAVHLAEPLGRHPAIIDILIERASVASENQ